VLLQNAPVLFLVNPFSHCSTPPFPGYAVLRLPNWSYPSCLLSRPNIVIFRPLPTPPHDPKAFRRRLLRARPFLFSQTSRFFQRPAFDVHDVGFLFLVCFRQNKTIDQTNSSELRHYFTLENARLPGKTWCANPSHQGSRALPAVSLKWKWFPFSRNVIFLVTSWY